MMEEKPDPNRFKSNLDCSYRHLTLNRCIFHQTSGVKIIIFHFFHFFWFFFLLKMAPQMFAINKSIPLYFNSSIHSVNLSTHSINSSNNFLSIDQISFGQICSTKLNFYSRIVLKISRDSRD